MVSELIRMIDAFIDKDYELVHKIYYDLPASKKSECAGQEFVGVWYDAFFSCCTIEDNLLNALEVDGDSSWRKNFTCIKAKIMLKSEKEHEIINTLEK